MIIAPSVLSMDYSKVEESMKLLNESKAQWLHFDVMDGHFVPNITFGPDILRGLSKLTNNLLDVHLMISNPKKYANEFIENGANLITVHWECFDDAEDALNFILELKKKGVKTGITSKPSTDIMEYQALLEEVDLVLVMSVEPGFGGQLFMMESLNKIRTLKELRDTNNYNYLIEVDGGINQETAKLVLDAGADVLVAGSYIFKADIIERVDSLWNL